MKTTLFLPLLFFVFVPRVWGDELQMIKIVSRIISDSLPAGSFAARPKTLYRAGYKYARTEEELNPADGIHALIVTDEPDIWMINLADKTGRHIVDPGPTFNFRAPLVWVPARDGQPEENKDFKDLEYGNEVEFFRRHDAKIAGSRVVDGKNCQALSIKSGAREFVLFLLKPAEPCQLDVLKNGKIEYSIRYVSYEVNLPFQKTLFEPPKDIKITEAKPSASARRYDEVAAWAKHDCDDYRELVKQTNCAQSGRDVAAAMRENIRRQQQTIEILLEFARSHPDLRDAAQLGLDKDGQIFWREHYPNRTASPAEVDAIQQQLTSCMQTVGAEAQTQMVNVLREYNQDKEVLTASMELHKMWAEHDRKLLEVLR